MNIKFLRTSLLGALMLAPNFAWSDADTSKIFLLANQSTASTQVTALEVYSSLDAKLSEFMRAQQLDTRLEALTSQERLRALVSQVWCKLSAVRISRMMTLQSHIRLHRMSKRAQRRAH